jgi:cell division protein FtsI/penicillin-binding protein 2
VFYDRQGAAEAVDAMTGMVLALTPVPQADPAQ